MMSQLKLTKNKDGTIKVQAGSYIEYISIESKSSMELLDCVRWAAITGGLSIDEGSLWEQLNQLSHH